MKKLQHLHDVVFGEQRVDTETRRTYKPDS